MKNKLLLTILIFIIFATCTYSQTCGTQFSEKRIEDLKSFYEKHDFSLSYKNKTVIPVTIWKGVEYIWSFNDYKIFELIDQANEQLAPQI
ncbi:MAG: hypothetical protein IPN89_06635 [Saprospiraceae bacterium]|nr:hypothetical protein [Saprospiraceae bacterium]